MSELSFVGMVAYKIRYKKNNGFEGPDESTKYAEYITVFSAVGADHHMVKSSLNDGYYLEQNSQLTQYRWWPSLKAAEEAYENQK